MSAVSILDQRGCVLKTIHTDAHDPDRMVEVMTVDLDPILRLAELQRQARGTGMSGHEEGMVLAGYIPPDVAERMSRDGSLDDEAALKRWLNDPQNNCFRVWQGRV